MSAFSHSRKPVRDALIFRQSRALSTVRKFAGETGLAGWLAGVGGFELWHPEKPPLELTATEGAIGAPYSLQVVSRDVASRRYRPKLLFLLWVSLASVEAGIRSSQFGAEQKDLTCIVYP
jgi:hypothetical protein